MSAFLNYLPPLIYGTAWKKDRTADLVESALLCGFRGIDTACQPKHYHEAGVGEGLLRVIKQGVDRDTLYIQTKFTPIAGQDPVTIPYNPSSSISEQVKQSVQTSLKNLNIDYLDALLLHSPLPTLDQTFLAWRTLEDLHHQGTIFRIGISNCYSLDVFTAIFNEAKIKPTLLQNRFYADTDYDKELRKWCDEHRVIYQSFWTLTANTHILLHPVMSQMASIYGVTVEQLFFRFVTQLGIIPLIGTCSKKHMEDDLDVFKFSLTDDQISQINAIL